jgi:hypothetical protein
MFAPLDAASRGPVGFWHDRFVARKRKPQKAIGTYGFKELLKRFNVFAIMEATAGRILPVNSLLGAIAFWALSPLRAAAVCCQA